MRLSNNEFPSPILPYPLTSDAMLEARDDGRRPSPVPNLRSTAELLDVVANRRRDLLPMLWQALRAAESTRDHAETLLDLVATCGSADKPSPCRTALAIAGDLDTLAETSSRWSHPAQVVESPDALALYRLCAARAQVAVGGERERLERILPRLERTARLVKKAASRRNNGNHKPKLVDRWL